MKENEKALLKNRMAETVTWVEAGLNDLGIFSDTALELTRLAGYSLKAGGKRVRPFLVRYSCRAFNGLDVAVIHIACAIEMIHTYSLIHDDLPSMDDDDLRRGKPTLHKIADAKRALFAGDLLLLEAFRELRRTQLDTSKVGRMVRTLVSAAGPGYLVGGQYMDMFPPDDIDSDWVERMIMGKTAALIRVSMVLGAMAADADDDDIQAVNRIGGKLGFLFQLTDDILDRKGDSKSMGKQVLKDESMGKCNTVSFMGISKAQEKALELAEEIAVELEQMPGNWESIRLLAQYLPQRSK